MFLFTIVRFQVDFTSDISIQLSANINRLWSWLYWPLEILTKVRLDPQKNRPDFYNLINAQPTRRQCIQHKINNSILLPLIKLHVCSHMMHQNFLSEVGTRSTKWWSTKWGTRSVGSMAKCASRWLGRYDEQSMVSISRQNFAIPAFHSQQVVQIDRSYSFAAAWSDHIHAQNMSIFDK